MDVCDKMEIQIGGQGKGLAEKYQVKRDGQKNNTRNEAGPDEETRREFLNEALVTPLQTSSLAMIWYVFTIRGPLVY